MFSQSQKMGTIDFDVMMLALAQWGQRPRWEQGGWVILSLGRVIVSPSIDS